MVTEDAFTLNSSRCKSVTNKAVLDVLVKKIGIIFSRALNQVLSRNAKHSLITDVVVYFIPNKLFKIYCYNRASVIFYWNSKEERQLIYSKQVNILFNVKPLLSLFLTHSAVSWLLPLLLHTNTRKIRTIYCLNQLVQKELDDDKWSKSLGGHLLPLWLQYWDDHDDWFWKGFGNIASFCQLWLRLT